jgi:hypothetical protein
MATKRTVKKPGTTRKVSAPEKYVSTHERVALLAYRYWEERGHPIGSDQEDWFRAEREIMEQLASPTQFRRA